MKLIPGGPFSQEELLSEELLNRLLNAHELDQPWYKQYWTYLCNLAHFDLGRSLKYDNRSVVEILSDGLFVSMFLGTVSLTIAMSFGFILGSSAALNQNKWQDHFCSAITLIGRSLPSFVAASLLQYFFAVRLGWLPVAQWNGPSYVILPAVALSIFPMAFIAENIRSNMIENLNKDFVLTAKMKGLSSIQIVIKHLLKNSLLPLLSYLGPLTANILTGSFVIEKIFGVPGMGRWLVWSIHNRDYPLIMGLTLLYSVFLMVAVFLADFLSLCLDPRGRRPG